MPYTIGIDVGGTNTDAALLHDDELIGVSKAPTNHRDLLASTAEALERVLSFAPPRGLEGLNLHLSTTLSTNAIVEKRGDPVAVLACPGPGMTLSDIDPGFPVHLLAGAVDHRGRETEPLSVSEIRDAFARARNEGARCLAAVGKFSTRNPGHELAIEAIAAKDSPGLLPVTLGHRLSGQLNFPRRLTTAYLNASVTRTQGRFVSMVEKLLERRHIGGRVYLLKADGGTLQLAESAARPVETILSGPAASIMGALAAGPPGDGITVIVDIGGTTTDVAVLSSGEPLFERGGAEIAGHKTVVPALFSRSFGLGGDSAVAWHGDSVEIGPKRVGPPAAMGGPAVTPTDAVVALGLVEIGDRAGAMRALEEMASPAGLSAPVLAGMILKTFCDRLAGHIEGVCGHLSALPVYTVSEMLAPKSFTPGRIIGLGAPAPTYIPMVAQRMGIAYSVLRQSGAANAIGAAASRPTAAITLRADTALGQMVVPELDLVAAIPHPLLYGQSHAREDAAQYARTFAARLGAGDGHDDVQIVTEESFNLVRGFHTVGRLFAVRAQVRPAVRRITLPDGGV